MSLSSSPIVEFTTPEVGEKREILMDDNEENMKRKLAKMNAPSPATKRCCKNDLKQCLRVGEMLVINRVEQHFLDKYNNGEKIRSRFTGNDFYDLSTHTPYRSLSKWVKKRLVDVGALGIKSNISGWDFVSVERDGKKQSLRMIVDNENEKIPSSQPISSTGDCFGMEEEDSIAKKMEDIRFLQKAQKSHNFVENDIERIKQDLQEAKNYASILEDRLKKIECVNRPSAQYTKKLRARK